MKTPRRRQNPLRAPLNDILGTEANVRLLRALALARGPVAAGELARRARLGRTTIYPALEGLERAGIIEFMGAGAQRQARFRQEHPRICGGSGKPSTEPSISMSPIRTAVPSRRSSDSFVIETRRMSRLSSVVVTSVRFSTMPMFATKRYSEVGD